MTPLLQHQQPPPPTSLLELCLPPGQAFSQCSIMPCLLSDTGQGSIQLKGRQHLQAAAAAPLLGRMLLGCCHTHSCRAVAAATAANIATTTTTGKAQVPGIVLSVQEAQVVKVPRRA